ncbi:PEP-CTERM sorting domain-containing protein [Duganella sp. BJB475]|nr:PEP-CTERM sorting domain-containing protein [Duganella sp. BJB475]RFP29616.1 PEP-CTERM sorting domain-containing protein [Duganella sp. BJB476]
MLCAAAFAAPSAFAANLITDGDFSAATLAAWTQGGDPLLQYVGYDYSYIPLTNEFNHVFSDGNYASAGLLGQQVATAPGYRYTLEFDLQRADTSFGALPAINDSEVLFNGVVVWHQTNTSSEWTHYVVSNLSTNKASTLLQFSNRNFYDVTAIDNVSLVLSAVPEPSSALMLSLGLGGLLLAGRAKRRRPD